MAGHSKWNNIKKDVKVHRMQKKGKIFMRHAKDIYVAAKQGGGDLDMNPTLRTAVDKARADNMPNDNIERAIKKATGTLDGVSYEEVTYEGYGPGGVAVIVHTLTDNRNRTAPEIRHAFSKNGGNLGESGSVSFMFDRKGYILILNQDGEIDEDELSLEAIEAGAEDILVQSDAFEIFTMPNNFEAAKAHLTENGYTLERSEITLFPQTYTTLTASDQEKMNALIDMLEESEDVQDIHHNMETDD